MKALQWGMRAAGLLLAGALAVATVPAAAQELQAGKPIRLIVGLSPGGGTDVTARLIAQQMTANTGMTVLVENKAGGNFSPALMEVARAAPDGHTIYFSSTSSLITQALHPDYPYDLRKFTAISEVATGPLILVVRNDLGVKSVKELIALAKQKPGSIRFGVGGGVGSSLGVSTALLQTLADIKINMVPYRGAAPALTDMLGGHIDAMIDAMPVMSVQAKEGKVTPLAVTGTKRSALLPDVPTMQESGFPTFVVTGWYGMFAPPGTPPAIAQKLRDEASKAIGPTEVVKTLASQGMEPRGTQPAEYAKYMEQEFAFYSKIIKDANIKPPQ
jgi:tripartite-type tricarboxylate transporter receptor subunit TctC